MSLVKVMIFKMRRAAKAVEKEHFRHQCRARGIPLYFSPIVYKWSLILVRGKRAHTTFVHARDSKDMRRKGSLSFKSHACFLLSLSSFALIRDYSQSISCAKIPARRKDRGGIKAYSRDVKVEFRELLAIMRG